MNETRAQALEQWAVERVAELMGGTAAPGTLVVVSGDASFRRYYRLRVGNHSYIVADAPPEQEDSGRFVAIAALLRQAGILVPRVYAGDLERGFLLLEDFGDRLYLPRLRLFQEEGRTEEVDALYRQAIVSLVRLQAGVDKERLDPYDRAGLKAEMALFDEWFCRGLLRLRPDAGERELIADTFRLLEDAALSQPAVAVHRDYHSRNLMLPDPARYADAGGPGILDFQDAVSGAYTYDLVSLLRDCYIRWPEERVRRWALIYLEQAQAAGIAAGRDEARFLRDFDLMGLQRHLKVMGIFSRLFLRDKKSAYLADIPLVIRYFRDVAARHPEMAAFLDWFDSTVLPVAESTLDPQDEG